jgi:hypothetical protein
MRVGGFQKTDRLLARAVSYVSDYWLPVDRDLLKRIREGVRLGRYDTDRVLLTEELCADTGIFFGCIRELKRILGEDDTSLRNPDITAILETANLDALKQAIDSFAESPALHLVSEGDDVQVLRLLESALSSTTASALAPSFGETSGRATSLAALRQLGYALVAWNYSSIYQEALDAVAANPTRSFDDEIALKLGFSPLLLSSRLAKKWGLSQDLVEASLIPSHPLYEEAHIVSSSHETLSLICRVSESIARANFESLYPTARAEWDAALQVVESHLGSDGIERIRERCAAACRAIVSGCPDIFRPGLLLDEMCLAALKSQDAGLDVRNPYLHLCSTEVRSQLEYLYEHYIRPSRPSEKAIRFLMRDVVKSATFQGGCVFTIDPLTCQLIPQLEMGNIALRTTEPISYMCEAASLDPVALAFFASDACEPVVVEKSRERMAAITSAFGRSQRLGVFYLEIPLSDLRANNAQLLINFKALNCALLDCLGL